MNDTLKHAAARWLSTKGDGMTDRDLEAARAYFQDRRNSRQVSRINALLRARLLRRLAGR